VAHRFALLTALAGLLTTAGGAIALTASTGPATANAADGSAPPSTSDQERGMASGSAFRDPANADIDGTGSDLTVTLDAADTRFDIAGKRVWGQTYNGAYIAPTIRFAPGADITIHLVNHLKVATNMHFHGLHVSPADHSDDDFLCIAPGASLDYHLAIPADHPQGTYWYHSHAMGTTCPAPGSAGLADMFMPADVENQIFAGLSGALIIGDDRSLLPPALRHITTHTMVLKDVQIDATGHIVQNTATTSIDSNAPTVRLVNGQLRPVLTMRPNETQLWRLANTGADIFYQLQLDGYRFTVIGEDGTPVAETTTADTLLLPPGKRYDVLVTAGSKPGKAWLRTTAYSNGPQGDNYPDTTLLKLNVAGPAVTPLPTVSGPIPTAPADLAGAWIAQRRTVDLSESSDGLSFYINGKQFDMNSSVFAEPARLGTVEEWTILNEAGEDHPFHLHVSPFQVMSVNGVAQPYTHVQDTVPIPHAVNGVPGKVVIRIPFDDFAGRWMFHCHIAAHEDNGMMSYINVVS
jgi:FtsP/CotA-like multicopper oxidase with cupredoxin domain